MRRFHPCLHSGCFATSSHYSLGQARLDHVCRQCFLLLPSAEQAKYTREGEVEFRSLGPLHHKESALVFVQPDAPFWGEELVGVDPREFLILEVRVGAYIQVDFPWQGCGPGEVISLLVERTGRSPERFRALVRGHKAPRNTSPEESPN